MAKVTIIVPIYKVEKYLKKCFESLLKQNADDCTILAVNDGSPDNCGAIIEEYVKKYVIFFPFFSLSLLPDR